MSITKRAFIQGLQRSLVSSGALPAYSSKWQAKHALDQAEDKLAKKEKSEGHEKEPDEMSEEDVSGIMTDLVEAEPLDEAVEALQEYQEAAGESEEATEELAEALKDVKDSKEAALAIRRLKLSNAMNHGGGVVGNELGGKGVADLQTGLGEAPKMPKGFKVDQLPPHAHVGPNVDGANVGVMSSVVKDRTGTSVKKSEVNAAINVLRKLAGEPAVVHPASQNMGDHEEDADRPVDYAAVNPVNNVAPVAPNTAVVPVGRDVLAHLVQKTAEEVGHFLPAELSDSDKLAALRTMVAMNGQERAAYIGRIKEAMYSPESQASSALRAMGL